MFHDEIEQGGPVMIAILVVWVVVMSLLMERLVFWMRHGLRLRRPGAGGISPRDACRNLVLIDGLSQIATSLGLFGTVLGIALSFFARGAELTLAAPEVLAAGVATALFTTVAGLAVFLVGQGALLVLTPLADAIVDRHSEECNREEE